MNNYIEFLESHLGMIECGWSKSWKEEELPFQVVKYKRGPFPGSVTYSTLGLSKQGLSSVVSNKHIRQELIFASNLTFGDKNIPGILQQVGNMALESKQAYLRGDVIGPFGNMFSNTDMQALYVSNPVYFPDTFTIYDGEENLPIIQAWLFPITLNEADFIEKNGWERFEDVLVETDPDLLDFTRQSIID